MKDYSEMIMDEIYAHAVMKQIKASSKIIRNVNLNKVTKFIEDGNKVVMLLDDGREICFEVMKSGFDVWMFYDTIDEISSEENNRTMYTNASGFVRIGNHVLLMRDIKKILEVLGTEIPASSVLSVMLDGFNGQNLVDKAKEENNLKKYVHIALERMCE